MTQYLLSVPHDSDEEPTMESMDPAELEAALGGRIEVRAFQEPPAE